jgi:L-arabinose isomerase
MIDLKADEVWFVTGSQLLYGPKTLEQVAEHSREIATVLSGSKHIPTQVRFKQVLTTPEAIRGLCLEANSAKNCIGLITWLHTFSPAKMWIAGLGLLKKPFLHLDTQYNREILWSEIAGIKFLLIDENTRLSEFKKELPWNVLYYHMASGL